MQESPSGASEALQKWWITFMDGAYSEAT